MSAISTFNILRVSLLVLLLGCLCSVSVNATHIIGGEITYTCDGNNQYTITLKVYRDCFTGGAQLDNPARITIWAGDNLVSPFNTYNVSPTITNIPPVVDNPCLSPPNNICVQEGVYKLTVTLPFNSSGYHISYERCCRNPTIANVPNPNTFGATYTIFLSNLAQTTCNNSPEFNDFPPIVICADQPLNFDHSATDAEGDSLSYTFCRPFQGASQFDPAPNVASPPPYTLLPYIVPTYITQYPMAGNPLVTIDTTTGIISGTPNVQGQFVVGVCLREYRNGQLLSTTRRDFQFNVTTCQQVVTAEIMADIVVGPDEFIVNSCGDSTITIINESGDVNFIDQYYWGFDIGNGDSLTSGDINPTLTFPDTGQYPGILVVNPGNETCTDTAEVTVFIYPPIMADFSHDWDTCSPGPINFTDLSTTGASNITDWTWAFADGNVSFDQNTSHQYQNPGTYVVTLQVEDVNGCIDQEFETFPWFPAPNISFNSDTTNGCEPLTVNFTNTSLPFNNNYTVYWDFGDGNTTDALNPSHTYQSNGIYDVTLAATAPNGCTDTLVFPQYISVYDTPIADFSFTYDSCAIDVVSFFDNSSPTQGNIVAWNWNFGDTNISDEQNPEHQYADAGSFIVTLTITDDFNCTQSVSQTVDWFPGPIISINPSSVNGCEPFEVFFENNSFPINGYTTFWELGDGTISFEASPTYTYTEAGIYTVTFTQTSPTGCVATDTFFNLITVDTLPTTDFSFVFDSCAIDVVSFTDFSVPGSGTISTWEWDFGDNTTSGDQNPEHLYPDAGNWDVELIVTNSNGCKDTLNQTVDWFPGPIIEVEPSVVKGCEPLDVVFQNNSFPLTGYTTVWNLGDGTIDTSASPIHTYTEAGIYTVTLTQTSPTGCVATDTFLNLITVDTLPTANFDFVFDTCAVGAITFQDGSVAGSGQLTDWFWDFGDNNSSIEQTPDYEYANVGTYDVELIVQNSNGCLDTIQQTVDYYPSTIIDFTVDDDRGCQTHSVSFTNNSAPLDGYSILWDFGDGQTSSDLNPSHDYPLAGVYDVTFSTISPIGCTASFTATNYITVDSLPIADFIWELNEDSCVVGPVIYTDQSINGSGAINNWLWDFDDGTGSDEIDPIHLFTGAGIFDVTLTVTDVNGCVDDSTQTIVWAPAPIIDVVPDDDWGCTPMTVNFQNNSFPVNGYDIFWDFGDGTQDTTVISPTHVYGEQGLYDVTLTVISPLGCVSTEVFEGMIKVDSVPTAQFDWTFQNCLVGLTNFDDESIEVDGRITSWQWDFGDGNFSDIPSPPHAYDSLGVYDVSLVVTDFNLCSDTVTQEVVWYPPADVRIDVDDYLGCIPHAVNFINNSTPMDEYTILWNFGDDSTSTLWEPSHLYPEPGNYDVTVQINNPIGCLVTETVDNMVRVTDPPVANFSFNPNNPTNFNPTVEFTESTQNTDTWYWLFGNNGDFSSEMNPTYTFPDTGLYAITLIASQLSGCSDSLTQFVDVSPQFTYYLPNAFTPNEDNLNDGFRGTGIIETINAFEMVIWNRWGEAVFTTNNPEEAWNGRRRNSGALSPNGVYVYKVKITSGRGEVFDYEGFVTLIR